MALKSLKSSNAIISTARRTFRIISMCSILNLFKTPKDLQPLPVVFTSLNKVHLIIFQISPSSSFLDNIIAVSLSKLFLKFFSVSYKQNTCV